MSAGDRSDPHVVVEHKDLQYVDNFPYIGSYISRESDIDVDVRVRTGQASAVFQTLRPIWSSTTIKIDMTLHCYTYTDIYWLRNMERYIKNKKY